MSPRAVLILRRAAAVLMGAPWVYVAIMAIDRMIYLGMMRSVGIGASGLVLAFTALECAAAAAITIGIRQIEAFFLLGTKKGAES